jgi:G3E family GTPase
LFYAQGFAERMLFQSVRMLTSLQRDRLWKPDEAKHNQFVVIGRNLERMSLLKVRQVRNLEILTTLP